MENFKERKRQLWQQFLTDSKSHNSPSGGMKVFLFVLLLFFVWLTAEKLIK